MKMPAKEVDHIAQVVAFEELTTTLLGEHNEEKDLKKALDTIITYHSKKASIGGDQIIKALPSIEIIPPTPSPTPSSSSSPVASVECYSLHHRIRARNPIGSEQTSAFLTADDEDKSNQHQATKTLLSSTRSQRYSPSSSSRTMSTSTTKSLPLVALAVAALHLVLFGLAIVSLDSILVRSMVEARLVLKNNHQPLSPGASLGGGPSPSTMLFNKKSGGGSKPIPLALLATMMKSGE